MRRRKKSLSFRLKWNFIICVLHEEFVLMEEEKKVKSLLTNLFEFESIQEGNEEKRFCSMNRIYTFRLSTKEKGLSTS